MPRKPTHSAIIVTACFVLGVGYVVVSLAVQGCDNGVRGGVCETHGVDGPGFRVTAHEAGQPSSVTKQRSSPAGSNPALAPLMYAIMMVESGGDESAVGDKGLSLGPYQCGRAAWQDACEWLGEDIDYDAGVFDRATTEKIMVAYWERYGAATDEQKARLWNGGPSMKGTDGYWARVQQYLDVTIH